jgi:hypothetical protein
MKLNFDVYYIVKEIRNTDSRLTVKHVAGPFGEYTDAVDERQKLGRAADCNYRVAAATVDVELY